MGKGGKVNRRNFKRSVRSRDIGSDGSDEDYVVEFEGNGSGDDSEDLGNSVDEYESDEGFGSYVEEDDEDEGYRKVVRLKTRTGSRAIGKKRGKISRKRKRVSYEEEVEEEEEKEEEEEEEEKVEDEDFVNDEEDKEEEEEKVEDEDFVNEDDEDEDEDDEEFSPEEDDEDDDDDDDFVDEDDELTVSKRSNNTKVAKRTTKKRGTRVRRTKRVKKSRVSKKPSKTRARNKRRLKKKVRLECDEDEYEGDFIDDRTGSREKRRTNSGLRRRNCAVSSDSEFALSGASDYDYTISEEEREQVREASKLFGEVKPNLRSSSSVKKIEEDGEDVCQHGKSLVRKGKEKLKEVNSEMGKQVCGICLSEEDKRRFRGTLDCCSHYFCFTCIMEWSKVESRCPLCKQRFKTITKHGRAAATVGVDLRNAVIEVPKRDQVYQPSEEEIRSFIDPYENVICTECHEGGDDGLMLLCDLCDSPAHTFCVGLGRQVPEGNWYCDGCRPIALASSSTQPQDPSPDQRTETNIFNRPSPVQNNGEGFSLDPNVESSPRLQFIQGFGNLPSPRFSTGDIQLSGTGAPTLSVRRQIHRHIQNLLSINRMHMASRLDSTSASNLHSDLSNPQIETGASRMPEMPSRCIFLDERLETNGHPSSSLQNVNPFPLRADQSGVQRVQDQAATAAERPVNLTLWPELSGRNAISTREEFHQHTRPGIAFGVNLSPHRAREESQFYVVKEQLQSMVRSHLKSLSQDIQLGNDTVKEIARSSTHTILAACGLEHKRSEVQLVPAPAICIHGDRLIAGQTSIMKGFCSTCFESFARDVVKRIMDTRLPGWLSLGL
ncbi:RING/U-box protein [Euphorbia peplus]|nr:RING/U-box protein [Euphorbia peplus]